MFFNVFQCLFNVFSMFQLAVPGLLLYGIGLPLVVIVVLWRHRHIHSMNKYVFTLGLLYSGYRKDRWWWESIVLLRKFLVIVVAAFLYEDAMQLHVMMMLFIVAFALHHIYLPFHVQASNDGKDSNDGNAFNDGKGGGGGTKSSKESKESNGSSNSNSAPTESKTTGNATGNATLGEETSLPVEENTASTASTAREKTAASSSGTEGVTEHGMLLHRLESNSLLSLLLLLWAANVFVLSEDQCNSFACVGLTVVRRGRLF
jgi:hypothetical protein